MEQGDAARCAREMASAVASFCKSEGLIADKKRLDQFHSAAFSQAFEFIPDTALATVISLTEADGLPVLVAIEGQHFYKLFFDEFEPRSDDVPITICEMTQVKPEKGYVKVEAQYDPTGPRRNTAWTFGIDERFNLSFQTYFDPEDEMDERERFARALASALGWGGFS